MTTTLSVLRRTTLLFPLCLLTLALHPEEMPGPVGAHGPALSLLLIMAWSGLTRDVSAAGTEVDLLLERGRQLLLHGQFADALSQYHTAVETDPDNYMTYFQRATVYLAMGKSRSALPDLDKVLILKPDFNAARLQRASVKVKQGRLDEAISDYDEILSRDPTFNNAVEGLNAIGPLRENIANGKALYSLQDFANAAHLLSQAIEQCPWDVELRELRADCYLSMGEFQKSVADLRASTKLISDNTAGYLKLSKLLYDIGNSEESLIEIRECLKLDPDQQTCLKHYRQVRKLVKAEEGVTKAKEGSHWDECLTKIKQFEKVENKIPAYVTRSMAYLCSCQSHAGHIEEALEACGRLLEREPDNVEALCDRADAHLLNENYETASTDFKKAESIESGDDRLKMRSKEGVTKAEKLLKQSKKRDYYKILGIKRNANKAEIMKAYRKLAAQWHPDSQAEGSDKELAEKKFIDIAAAKEVLTDPEKRSKFDQGEDPLDAEQQAGPRGGHPFFHQGFDPYGQGGFQFKFHFN